MNEATKSMTKDPVCGMSVDPATALQAERSTLAGAKPKELKILMKNKSRFCAKDSMFKLAALRTALMVMAICSPVQVAHAQHANGNGMHGADGGWMGGWAGGGMWLLVVIGVLVVVLLAVLIGKMSKK